MKYPKLRIFCQNIPSKKKTYKTTQTFNKFLKSCQNGVAEINCLAESPKNPLLSKWQSLTKLLKLDLFF